MSVRSPNRQAKPPLDLRLGAFFLWLLVLVAPFALASVAKESFREPKLLAGEWLALASLVCFAWGLRRVETVRLAEIWRLPALRLIVPCLLVATAGLAASPHPLQVRDALIDLWIGGAALVGWSVALPATRLERLLRGLLWPASLMALIGILQYFGFQPLDLAGSQRTGRLAITSLAGNPGDLAAYLVLPCLVAQLSLGRRLRAGEGWASPRVWGTALALALSLFPGRGCGGSGSVDRRGGALAAPCAGEGAGAVPGRLEPASHRPARRLAHRRVDAARAPADRGRPGCLPG
jgi:hypothetical protein